MKSLTDVLDIDADDGDNDDDNDDGDDNGDGDDDGVSKRCSHQKIPLQRRIILALCILGENTKCTDCQKLQEENKKNISLLNSS